MKSVINSVIITLGGERDRVGPQWTSNYDDTMLDKLIVTN